MHSNCACSWVLLWHLHLFISCFKHIYPLLVTLLTLSTHSSLFLMVSLIYFQDIRSKSKTPNKRSIRSWGLCHQWIDVSHRECTFNPRMYVASAALSLVDTLSLSQCVCVCVVSVWAHEPQCTHVSQRTTSISHLFFHIKWIPGLNPSHQACTVSTLSSEASHQLCT